MTVQTFLPLLAAFFWGCLLTEIRWIGKMRRLRADAGAQGDPPREDTLQSLLNLQQQLRAAAQASPVPESATTSKA